MEEESVDDHRQYICGQLFANEYAYSPCMGLLIGCIPAKWKKLATPTMGVAKHVEPLCLMKGGSGGCIARPASNQRTGPVEMSTDAASEALLLVFYLFSYHLVGITFAHSLPRSNEHRVPASDKAARRMLRVEKCILPSHYLGGKGF